MSDEQLKANLAKWFHRLGSDDPGWWAKELAAYLEGAYEMVPMNLEEMAVLDKEDTG